jgi:hypothetical protein
MLALSRMNWGKYWKGDEFWMSRCGRPTFVILWRWSLMSYDRFCGSVSLFIRDNGLVMSDCAIDCERFCKSPRGWSAFMLWQSRVVEKLTRPNYHCIDLLEGHLFQIIRWDWRPSRYMPQTVFPARMWSIVALISISEIIYIWSHVAIVLIKLWFNPKCYHTAAKSIFFFPCILLQGDPSDILSN